MKKALSIFAVAVLATAFVACGPSAEEKAQMEERAKHIQDSISSSVTESMQTNESTTDSTAVAPATTETTAPAADDHSGHNH